MRKYLTTTGRFWGYVSIFIALAVSLAGNVTAAYLHDKHPSWVDLGFAGIPPLVAFLSVEVVNHNPWTGTDWGRYVRGVLLGVVTPASAIVSFIHLTTVVITGRTHDGSPEGVLNWITAVLTALLIDGLMIGGTAALLLPKAQKDAIALQAAPDWRGELEAARSALVAEFDGLKASLEVEMAAKVAAMRPAPVVRATLAKQPAKTPKQRFKPHEHPLWNDWMSARQAGSPWAPEDFVLAAKKKMDKVVTPAAAQTQMGRWAKVVAS